MEYTKEDLEAVYSEAASNIESFYHSGKPGGLIRTIAYFRVFSENIQLYIIKSKRIFEVNPSLEGYAIELKNKLIATYKPK